MKNGMPQTVEEFLSSDLRNFWLRKPGTPIRVYVRRGIRLLDGQRLNVLDLASIQVDSGKEGKGVFTRWLPGAISAARSGGVQGVFIENVMSKRFAAFFDRNGFVRLPRSYSEAAPCFYLKFDMENRDAHSSAAEPR